MVENAFLDDKRQGGPQRNVPCLISYTYHEDAVVAAKQGLFGYIRQGSLGFSFGYGEVLHLQPFFFGCDALTIVSVEEVAGQESA
jgi:hypothetical protein